MKITGEVGIDDWHLLLHYILIVTININILTINLLLSLNHYHVKVQKGF